MNPVEAILLYTPFPYWAGFVLLLYRHDLSRLVHPIRDGSSLSRWWAVLNHLGLLSAVQTTHKPKRRKGVLLHAIWLGASLGLSLSWVTRVVPVAWPNLVAAQCLSGTILALATAHYLGPLPAKPYLDVLRYPRLGSRIRHLRKIRRREAERQMQQDALVNNNERTQRA